MDSQNLDYISGVPSSTTVAFGIYIGVLSFCETTIWEGSATRLLIFRVPNK